MVQKTNTGIVIAIDGPVAAGKGTLARRIAAHFGFAYLDTGSLYRATGSKVLRAGRDPADLDASAAAAAGLTEADLSAPDLREEKVGTAASVVASQPRVRAALLDYQRRYALTPPGGQKGAVLDGRDIGTVVCPDAPVKLFVTASAEIRAHRRWLELKGKGQELPEAQVLEDLRARDDRDMNRADAPLKPAGDAHLLDTTNMDIEAAFRAARDYVAARI